MPMKLIEYSHVVLGVMGAILFCTALWEIKGMILKKEQPYRRALTGWAMSLFFLMQIVMFYENMQNYPKWATIVVLVGIGFGISGGVLIIRSSKGITQRET
jgi:hypothetical protein